jgi:hypothetical protein
MAILRRFDLDGDCRLTKDEFFEGIMPLENFTRNSVEELKNQLAVK